MGVNWCNRCGGYGAGTIRDPARRWWEFWKRIKCPGCGGDGISKPPGWPDRAEMERLRPPPPPPPPPIERYHKGHLPPVQGKPVEVWVVGQTISDRVWEIQGIFSTRKKAIAACRDSSYFVGPATIDEAWPHESVEWPGAYYPSQEGAG